MGAPDTLGVQQPASLLRDAFEFSPREILAVLTVALLANLFGALAVIKLNTLFFLDMMGTAIAAVALGPWWAATVGLATNAAIAMLWQRAWFDFLPDNVMGGLFWGYVGRVLWPVFRPGFREIHILGRMLALGVAGGIVVSLFAVPIRLHFQWQISEAMLEDMATGHLVDRFYLWFVNAGLIAPTGSWLKLVAADLGTSVPDKTLSFSFALLVAYHLFPRLRWELEDAKADRRYDGYPAPGALLTFIVLYLPLWAVVVLRGPWVRSESALWTMPLALAVACLAFCSKSRANGLLAMAAARRRRRAEIEPPPPRADLWTTYTVVNVLFVSVYAALVGTLLENDATGKLALASVGWSPFLLGGSLYALGGIITLRDLARR